MTNNLKQPNTNAVSDREALNESFTVHDGIGFSFGKGRTTAASAERMFSLRKEIGDVSLTGIEKRYVYRFFKRTFDICFSALVLVCFCWLYAAITLWIKVDDPKGPVIFKQERVGKNGKRFYMHKFRSMVVNAEDKLAELQHLNEKTGPVFKIKKDPRVTHAGYWLRKLSLDELPRFWDVLKGNLPLRILKTRQDSAGNPTGEFALPAKEMRTEKAAFSQVDCFVAGGLWTLQNFFDNFSAVVAPSRRDFCKMHSERLFAEVSVAPRALSSLLAKVLSTLSKPIDSAFRGVLLGSASVRHVLLRAGALLPRRGFGSAGVSLACVMPPVTMEVSR